VKDIHLTPEQFTIENGLLTPTLKSKRVQLEQRYKEQIESMYNELE
jgi:long-chain acyl-CoA synthetase